jgi:hypothetical protein
MSVHASEVPPSGRFAGTVAVERTKEESTDVCIGLTDAARDRPVSTMRKKGTTNGYRYGTTCFQD